MIDDSNKGSPQNQGVTDKNPVTPKLHPLPRTFEGKEYYGASDVAQIMGVTRITVLQWHKKELFTADKRTHDGVYLYEIERVMQLKSVYHPNWMRGGYEPSPTTSEPTHTQFTPPTPSKSEVNEPPTPDKAKKTDYMSTNDVAKIIGVDRTTVIYWRKQGLFTADMIDHAGVYYYTVERVTQLKAVYHPNWKRGGYQPSPTTSEPTHTQFTPPTNEGTNRA